MPHVKAASDIWGGHGDHIGGGVWVVCGGKVTLGFPPLCGGVVVVVVVVGVLLGGDCCVCVVVRKCVGG